MKTVKISLLQGIVFVLSWTPYSVLATWSVTMYEIFWEILGFHYPSIQILFKYLTTLKTTKCRPMKSFLSFPYVMINMICHWAVFACDFQGHRGQGRGCWRTRNFAWDDLSNSGLQLLFQFLHVRSILLH